MKGEKGDGITVPLFVSPLHVLHFSFVANKAARAMPERLSLEHGTINQSILQTPVPLVTLDESVFSVCETPSSRDLPTSCNAIGSFPRAYLWQITALPLTKWTRMH